MAKPSVYEFIVVHHPSATKEQKDAGQQPQSVVIVSRSELLASSEQEALIHVSRMIPEEHLGHLNEVEISIRPF